MNPIEQLTGVDPWALFGLIMSLFIVVLMVLAGIEERKEKRRKERQEMGLPDESI